MCLASNDCYLSNAIVPRGASGCQIGDTTIAFQYIPLHLNPAESEVFPVFERVGMR